MKWLCKIKLHKWIETPRRLGIGLYPEHKYCDRCGAEQVCSGFPWFIWTSLDEDEKMMPERDKPRQLSSDLPDIEILTFNDLIKLFDNPEAKEKMRIEKEEWKKRFK